MEDGLRDIVGKDRHVRTQTPLALGARDEPEPEARVAIAELLPGRRPPAG